MYRAVHKASFVPDTVYSEQKTKRVPNNVPHIIDNLWEMFRTEEFPSRRFSAYASPTPAPLAISKMIMSSVRSFLRGQ